MQNTLSYICKRVLNAPLLGATIKCCVRFKQNRKIQKLSDEKHIGLISENSAKKKRKSRERKMKNVFGLGYILLHKSANQGEIY